ncbi:MAG: sugar kinase [Pseudomonadota bacterium]
MTPTVICIGECMVELARTHTGQFSLSFGGDTFNTATYIARMRNVTSRYVTALGDDQYSDGIVARAEAEGIDTRLIARCADRMPGLYMIETDASGERTFWYWRDRAPARELFAYVDRKALHAAVTEAGIVYISGVTLSILDESGRDALAELLKAAKTAGAQIAMDSNFRPRAWVKDRDQAREVFARFWRLADIALPTFDDEHVLWGDTAPERTADRLQDFGAREIVVKSGYRPALIRSDGTLSWSLPEAVQSPVDTTAAGDAFNAGYVAARLRNKTPEDAARFAHQLAARVIEHRGAIIPRAETDDIYEMIEGAV